MKKIFWLQSMITIVQIILFAVLMFMATSVYAAHLACDPYVPSATMTYNVYFDASSGISTSSTPYPGTTTGQVYLYYDCTALANGPHTVYATACYGTLCSTASITLTFTKALPTIATIVWSGQFLNSQVYAIGNSTEPTYFTLSFDGGTAIQSNAAAITGGVWLNYDASALADGAHTVVVTTYNVWGSVASTSFAFNKGKPNSPANLKVLP